MAKRAADSSCDRKRRAGQYAGVWIAAALAALLPQGAPSLPPTADRPSADEVKSAYLFNFGKFVEYPKGNPSLQTFDICVLGNDPIAHDLEETTRNERMNDVPVRVLHYDHAGEARDCAVVYMGGSEAARLDKDLTALEGSNALTVSDQPQFLNHGGMIQFLLENSRIRFAVNLDAVGHTHFQLSSELLKVAVYVNTKPRQEEKR
ncbi:MAG: YfiR family protein [Terracidiphilus sp.]